MKKTLIVLSACLALGLAPTASSAQALPTVPKGKYTLTMQLKYLRNDGHHMDRGIWLDIMADGTDNPKFVSGVGNLDTRHSVENLEIGTLEFERKPSRLKFLSSRWWRYWNLSGWHTTGRDETNYFTIPSDSYEEIITRSNGNRGIVVGCDARLYLYFRPKKIDLFYYEKVLKETLPFADEITLAATRGYDSNIYNWEYSLDGGNLWKRVDDSFKQNGNEEIRLKGSDLLDEQQFFAQQNSILFRVNTPTAENPDVPIVKALTPQLSSPHITDVEIMSLESYNGANDAVLKFYLDRVPYENEVVYIKRNNRIPETVTPISSPEGSYVIFNNVASGENIEFSIATALFDDDLYFLSDRHKRTVTVPPCPIITHSIPTTGNISCYGGSDGFITVKPEGGREAFIAKLYRRDVDNVNPWKTEAVNGSYTFSDLPNGQYRVTIEGALGGFSDNNNPNEIIELTQPAEPLTVQVVGSSNPKGYDSADGSARLKVRGGTSDYTVKLSHEDGYTPQVTRTEQVGDDVFYTYEKLGRGQYFITIEDANNKPEFADPCACRAVGGFELTAPPLLTVSMKENSPILWNGGNQGKLTAHARGGVKPYEFRWSRMEAGTMRPLEIRDSIAFDLTAGVYRVKVVDANKVFVESADHTLAQPEPLSAQFTVVQTGCAGGNSGSIEAIVSGGIAPYTYQWNVEGAAENRLTGLAAGSYMVKITDSRGGYKTYTVEVGSASDLKIDRSVSQITCSSLGKFSMKLNGGNPPYTLRWSDLSQTEDLAAGAEYTRLDLEPGSYKLEIADANGCRNYESFVITQPEALSVELGGDLTMCRNQSRRVEAVCNASGLKFEWFFNGAKLPDIGKSIVVDKAGKYSVKISNGDGCSATDDVNVSVTGDVLELDMTVPTKVEVGTQINAVNLSTMPADRIEWLIPDDATVVESSDLKLVFRIDKTGTHSISMEGFKGEGATIVTREIEVVDKGGVDLPTKPLIKQFWATPNPSTGYFKVVVELERAEDFTMMLYSPSGALIDTKKESASRGKTFEYEIAGSGDGTYLLHVLTKTDKSVLRIVIAR